MTQRRHLARLLLVALVTLVVAAGAATAHGTAGPGTMGGYVATGAGTHECGGAWTGMMHGGYGGMMGGAGGWGATGVGTWGFLWPLVLVALAVGFGYVVLTRSGGDGGDRALEVLRERYARGELSDEEYVSRREALRG